MENFETIATVASNNGFEVTDSVEVNEITGAAHLMRHKKTGARLIYLENEDNNKAFSIAFKTPPKDSTGVFHILEHSVLCGSKRYPVKEPFVNLLKSSMQTFLNAMTFPDKTVYPVASTSEQDLENLMNVYLDAVFNPRIYDAKEIFEQEGWHHETTEEGKLDFSGVVYNEMKGALSDPDSVLMDALCERLYPGTAYEYESGGLPTKIPELTYEDFLDQHARHYNPANSYITLYGNLDLNRFLKIIDCDYLSKAKADSKKIPNPLEVSKKTLTELYQVKMATSKQSASAALAFKIGEITDVVKCEMINILFDVLMSTNVSALKKKLLMSDLADEYFYNVYEPVKEPALVLGMQGMNEAGELEEFERVLRESLAQLLEEGLDHELIEASINHFELVMREHNFGVADGVTYALDLLSTWLYDDTMPLAGLRYEKVFEELRAELKTGGFESAIKELILNNDDVARVEIVAVDDDVNEQPVGFGKDLVNSEIEKIDSSVARLNEIQAAPDREEDLARLPYLAKSDIKGQCVVERYDVQDVDGVRNIAHRNLNTNGLNYYNLYFDLSHLGERELPYLSLFAMFLAKFDTADFTAEQIVLESKKWAGSGSFANFIATDLETNSDSLMLRCGTSCLQGNDEHVFRLINSIIHTTDFSDENKIVQLISQARLSMEQSLVNAGHIFAMRRADANYSTANALKERLSGISYYEFLCEICADLGSNIGKIQEELKKIQTALLPKCVLTISSTCSDERLASLLNLLDASEEQVEKQNVKLAFDNRANEAFAVKSDVTYTALRNRFKAIEDDKKFSGTWPVLSRVLSYDYLWNTIRVQGGAYGCGFNAKRNGSCGFYTYRDPNITSSIDRFMKAGEWLSSFNPSKKEFEGFVVSAVANFDEPKKAVQRVARGDGQVFSGIDKDDRIRCREELLSVDIGSLKEQAQFVTKIADSGSVCTVGNKKTISDSSQFDTIVDL